MFYLSPLFLIAMVDSEVNKKDIISNNITSFFKIQQQGIFYMHYPTDRTKISISVDKYMLSALLN